MTIDLDKLEQLARAATLQGKRAIEQDGDGYTVGFAPDHYVGYLPREDAELVAAMDPRTVLELLDLIEHLRGDVPERERYLVKRCAAAEAIVRVLAECVRPAEADYGTCLLCDQNPCAPSCPYRRAVEATKP